MDRRLQPRVALDARLQLVVDLFYEPPQLMLPDVLIRGQTVQRRTCYPRVQHRANL